MSNLSPAVTGSTIGAPAAHGHGDQVPTTTVQAHGAPEDVVAEGGPDHTTSHSRRQNLCTAVDPAKHASEARKQTKKKFRREIMHHPTALARRRVREVSSPRRRGVRRRDPQQAT